MIVNHVSIVEFAQTLSMVLNVPVQVTSVEHFVKLVSSNSMAGDLQYVIVLNFQLCFDIQYQT